MAVKRALLTIGVIGIMAAFAVTDALYIAEPLPMFASVNSESSSSSSVIEKQESIDVLAAIEAKEIDAQQTTEEFFLPSIVQDNSVQSRSLVASNDRIGSIAWTESANVKTYYQALKQALHKNFTGDVQDLRDQTTREPNEAVKNQLTFYDPGISSQRLVFLRIRDRFYEVRIELGKEELMQPLLDELAK